MEDLEKVLRITERAMLVRRMHYIVQHINDENAYMEWIELVPDQPSNEDIVFIATRDDLFEATTELFADLVARYARGKAGFCIT